VHHRALVGGIELNDADVANRRLAGLLLEAEGQPYGAELDRLAVTALGDACLRQCLGDAQPLPFQRRSRTTRM